MKRKHAPGVGHYALCKRLKTIRYMFAQSNDEVTCLDCRKRLGLDKPTPEQVAWVFRQIIANTRQESGSFRYLIYDRMGFGYDEYALLDRAGGMAINNAMIDYYRHEKKEKDD